MYEAQRPRNYPGAVSLRQTEPYHFQRHRDSMHSSYPRPPQSAIQPNRLPRLTGWGMGTIDYWRNLSDRMRKRL